VTDGSGATHRAPAPGFAPFVAPVFSPPAGLRGGNAQTLYPFFMRRAPRLRPHVEDWQMPDGEALSVYLLEPAGSRPDRPGLLVVHGLEGSSDSHYVRGLLGRVQQAGWYAAAFDMRSCGPRGRPRQPSRTAYHAGKSEDLAFVVERLSARWGGRPLAVVGFSLGGNMMLKWLGEAGAAAPVAAAVAVSVPFDLAACAAAIDGPGFWNGLYRAQFMRSLRRKALALCRTDPGRLDPRLVAACRTFGAFDDHVTAPLHGFAGAQDYWTRCSARFFLGRIRRPTLLIAAQDDPLVPVASLPRADIAANPALTLWLPAHGGHVGFVGGSLRRPRYAAEEAVMAYVGAQTGAHMAETPNGALE
jgi:predicted alpha/beta-fold hydrolase